MDIPPKSFRAANEETFSTNGKGELVIDIPDGVEYSQLCLMEVLDPPEVVYTPVSIGRLDEKGFSVTPDRGKCTIRELYSVEDGSVLRNEKGAQVHSPDSEKVAVERNIYFIRRACQFLVSRGRVREKWAKCKLTNLLLQNLPISHYSIPLPIQH